GRDGQSQREVGFDESRFVEIVEGVTGERPAALQLLVVAKLKQPPFVRINLGMGDTGCAETDEEHPTAPLCSPRHARSRNANRSRPASQLRRHKSVLCDSRGLFFTR